MMGLIEVLSGMKDNKEIINFLGDQYPELCVYILNKRGLKRELQKYTKRCKNCEDDAGKYTLYIQGYWLPDLQLLEEKGVLK